MKNRNFMLVTLLGLAPLATAAQAENTYVGFGVNMWSVDLAVPGVSASFDPMGIDGRYGYHVYDNFAIEGRVGFGVQDDDELEVSQHYGVYVKGILDINETFQPYVALGYTNLTLDAGGDDADDTDLSYLVGADLNFGRNWGMNVEYGRMYSDDGLDIDTVGLGLRYRF